MRIGIGALVAAGVGAGTAWGQLGTGDFAGFAGGGTIGAGLPPALIAAPRGARVLRVRGFDPVRDVAMLPNTDGVCYGITQLTAIFFAQVRFVPRAGLPLAEWRLRPDRQALPVRYDEEVAARLPGFLAEPHRTPLLVGGFEGLAGFSSLERVSGHDFAAWVKRIHDRLQDRNDLDRIGRHRFANAFGLNLLRGSLAELEGALGAGHLVTLDVWKHGGQGGHAVLAYELEEREHEVRVRCHDPNALPVGGRARPLTMVFDREGATVRFESTPGADTYAYDRFQISDIGHPEATRLVGQIFRQD